MRVIKEQGDRQLFRKTLNDKKSIVILFQIGLKNVFGGVKIDDLNSPHNGFRRKTLIPYYVLNNFNEKNKKRQRLIAHKYSQDRIIERTSGEYDVSRKFIIAGLGSIGSNLCFFLNGFNDAAFKLIDSDTLSVDNIGRHLLGFEYIDQPKSYAVSDYLKRYRPDRDVESFSVNIESVIADKPQIFSEEFSLFICTGNLMSELYTLDGIYKRTILSPTYILWLEPYAISGIMLYINPKDNLDFLFDLQKRRFECLRLISDEEYNIPERFTKKDAGCNGTYTNYSGNDVMSFLSCIYPIITNLLVSPQNSQCFRWVGNIEIAKSKGIKLADAGGLIKNQIQRISFEGKPILF